MEIILIAIAILIIWFIWGLNNKNKMANRISSMGGIRVVYAVLINEYLAMGGQIIAEKKDSISLLVHGRDSSLLSVGIAQNFDEVPIAIVVTQHQLGKVSRMFSFPMGMDQHLMIDQIEKTMARLIAEKMK